MAKTLYEAPNAISFVTDGIQYTIREVVTPSTRPTPISLLFNIEYFNKNARINRPQSVSDECQLLVHGERYSYNSIFSILWNVDITDIVTSFAQRLCIDRLGYINGYATVQLVEIDGVATDIDENPHICLFGTSGGINIYDGGELPANTHPFLLARGNDEGALHFYRAELKAMDVIYALKPDAYDDIYFDTDNESHPSQDLDQDERRIYDRTELLGLHYYTGDIGNQYDVTSASAIFLHLTSETPGTESRMYTIAVQDDPDTDDIYLLRWTNSMGAPEALLLIGELQDASEIEEQDPYITSQTVNNTMRAYKRRKVTTKYSLHTGYLTPARIIALKDMITSEEVEMQIDGQWVPVSVTADTKHAVHQREPETFELTIEVLEQTRYHKPNRTVRPLPATRAGLLQDNSGNIILDNNSNTIQENG
jgi:hypothetical protein